MKENILTNSKDILINLLRKKFDDKLKQLESRTNYQFFIINQTTNMNESNTNNYNNKEKELQENQTKELKEKELKEKEMKENELKENEFINLKFIYNGNLTEEITIQCNKNDLIKDLIERYKMKKKNMNI